MSWFTHVILIAKAALLIVPWVAMALASRRYLRRRDRKRNELFPNIKIRRIAWIEVPSEKIDTDSLEGRLFQEYCRKISRDAIPVFAISIAALVLGFLLPVDVAGIR